MNLTPETLVEVTNRSNAVVVYKIPERRIRREFNRKETKKVPYQEILDVAAQPGGRSLIYNFLLIHNPEAVREGLNVKEELEYWLTEEKIPEWMQTCTLDEFKDCLDFAPEGVKSLIKSYAVSLPLNDVSKRQAILDQLKFDVNSAIQNEMAAAEPEVDTTKTSGRRVKPTESKYKIVDKK